MLTKPRNASRASNTSMYAPHKRRRLSPLMIIGISVPVLLALIGVGVVVVLPQLNSHAAAAVNPNCTVIVPANALSAQGLATPYLLFAPDAAANGPCNEANANQGAFVQADIYDPATGQISTYSPLIIDQGTQPAVVPTAPTLPAGAVVGLWFGFNGTNLTLQGAQGNTLADAKCVNGLPGSIFGQFSYCNARTFFTAAKQGIAAGKVQVPALGTAKDGLTCPTTRDFSVIDQDQSDNVQTQYLANGNGQTAQLSAANQAQLQNATTLGNPSDNALVSKFIDPTLGCTAWQVPDLANNNNPVPTLATDELQAAAGQQAPIALVPLTDPMTLNNAAASAQKATLYRRGSDQPAVNANNPATNGSGTTYCQNFVGPNGLARVKNDMPITINATSPAPAMANSLFTFLAMRANQSYTNLGCQGLLNNAPNPVALTMDGNGVVISAVITLPGTAAAGGMTTTTTQTATGMATINLDANAGNATLALNVTYPNHNNAPITVSIVDSAAGKTLFSQQINTDNNGQAALNSAINGLQGLTAIPNTWVFNVADPNMNNTIVGTGTVVANGTTGTATLGTVAAAVKAAACTAGNAAAGNTAAVPTVAAGGNAVATPTVAAAGNAATGNAAATPTVAAAGNAAAGNAAATPTVVAVGNAAAGNAVATPTVAAAGNAAAGNAAATPTVAPNTACNTGTAPAAAPAATTPAAPVPTAPAAAGQVTTENAPYNHVAKHHHHMW